MPLARVVVVGLGPGDADLVTAGATAAIDTIADRFLRTDRHPAASLVAGATTFDSVYEHAEHLEQVYPEIVEQLVRVAVERGVVLYAVPGSPLVAERTVELLLADTRVAVEIVPAMSFLDLAWARLGVDPVAVGVRVVDGQRFAVEAAGERGPLLVAQCDSVAVLSEIKLVLDSGPDSALASDAEVVVLQRLGLPDEAVERVPWADLDRVVQPDHLTSLYLPELAAPVAGELARFAELVATLRRDCPWDRAQTHDSLKRHLLEETYELLEAIDRVDLATGDGYEHLEEELGDLLFQVVFHATLAAEEGQFTLADVATTVHDKLRDRHPHVFGGEPVDDIGELSRTWEQNKKLEKGRDSVFDGVPNELPALLYALKIQKKAASLADDGVPLPAMTVPEIAGDDDLGDRIFALVAGARASGIDPEDALRAAANRYRDVVRSAERGPLTP